MEPPHQSGMRVLSNSRLVSLARLLLVQSVHDGDWVERLNAADSQAATLAEPLLCDHPVDNLGDRQNHMPKSKVSLNDISVRALSPGQSVHEKVAGDKDLDAQRIPSMNIALLVNHLNLLKFFCTTSIWLSRHSRISLSASHCQEHIVWRILCQSHFVVMRPNMTTK